MGNSWTPEVDSSGSSSPCSTGPSSPGITISTSNEGMHSGTRSVFSSRLGEVSRNGKILPITPTLKNFSFAQLKKATWNFRLDTVVGEGRFAKVFKARSRMAAPTKAGSRMAAPTKAGSRMASVVMAVAAVQHWRRIYCQMKMEKLQDGCPPQGGRISKAKGSIS